MNQQELKTLGNWKQKLNRISDHFQTGDELQGEDELRQWRQFFAGYLKEIAPDEAGRFDEIMRDLDDPDKTRLPTLASYNDHVLKTCGRFLDDLLERRKKPA